VCRGQISIPAQPGNALVLKNLMAPVCGLALLALVVRADDDTSQASTSPHKKKKPMFRFVAVRYQVKDVDRSVAFYTGHLDFKLEQQAGPAFAKVSNGPLTLWLSGPKSSGSRPLPDGRPQEPGGFNRIALEVDDLPSRIAVIQAAGIPLRNEMEVGPGGRQIQIEDPDGNPIELFEPASPAK
jgi:glyoxylase I family protein